VFGGEPNRFPFSRQRSLRHNEYTTNFDCHLFPSEIAHPIVRLRYVVIFSAVGLGLLAAMPTARSSIGAALECWSAIAFLGVALAYAWLGPRTFLKRSDGRLSVFSHLLFGPYQLANHVVLVLSGLIGGQPRFSEVAEGLYVGRRLHFWDTAAVRKLGLTAVLDLTCEISEHDWVRKVPGYRLFRLLDRLAPTVSELDELACWIALQRKSGPVYVHCALGHGRSVLCVAAYLLLAGYASTPEEAMQQIQRVRPRAHLSRSQRECLAEFARQLPTSSVHQLPETG
jgi:hypothetical protein